MGGGGGGRSESERLARQVVGRGLYSLLSDLSLPAGVDDGDDVDDRCGVGV